jgi:hypothetical protein
MNIRHMDKKRQTAGLFLLLAQMAAPGIARSDISAHTPVVTRLVQEFMELESRLDSAARSGNQAVLNELLSGDFEQISGATPGDPAPRAEWLSQYAKDAALIPPFAMEHATAIEKGNQAILSYGWPTVKGPGFFVVDVWERNGEAWKLSGRYINPAGPATPRAPGNPTAKPAIRKKI